MKILLDYSTCQLTTLQTNNKAKIVVFLSDISQLQNLKKTIKDQPYLILGQGSNTLFIEDFEGIVVINQLKGITYVDNDNEVLVTASAGEVWHDFICLMVEKKLYGLENLVLIPGTVGAAPIQNIGAYGVEMSDCIDSVTVFDWQENCFKQFTHAQCEFAYRDSLFKQEESKKRYLITAATFKLSKQFIPNLTYAELNTFSKNISASELINQIIAIRQSKLPDVTKVPNAGSFFKNPIISQSAYDALVINHPSLPHFKVKNQYVKLSAAWLIEACGLKGYCEKSGVGIYLKHALILINQNRAEGQLVWQLVEKIQEKVSRKFGINLQPEVRVIEKKGEKQSGG